MPLSPISPTKFSNLGIIKIKMPAIRAMIGEMYAGIMVISISLVTGYDASKSR